MTPISPQDRNKAIALIAGIVVVFGFAFWRITSMSGGSPAPQTVQISTPPPVVSTATQPSGPNGGIVDVSVPSTAALINPFRTVLATKSEGASTPPTSVPSRPPGNLGTGTMPPVQLGGQIPTTMTVQPTLIGAVTGASPVAIFKVGSKEVVLHVGEKLDTGEVLESVHSDSAVLRKNGKRTVLNVGATKQN